MVNKEVTVEDLDKSGDFNFDEALVAAHKAYNKEDGYAVSISSYGSSVTTLWGEPTTNTLFFINGKGLSTGVADDKIADGDKLYASVNADDTNYADWYTAFDKDSLKATYGANVTLTLTGYQGMNSYLNPDMAPVVGVTVKTADGKTLGKTDKNGKVTFKAPAVGEYVVTAEGTVKDVITDWYMMDMGGETHPYGKMDFDTGDMTIAYTDEDYGEGPYPIDEVKYIDFFEEAAEDSENDYAWQDLHYLKSNQLIADCPIMAPAAKLTVAPAKISKAKATKIADKYYTGKAIKPTPTLKFNGKKLKKGTDFTVTYKANKAVGKATITVKGKGNFTGTKKVTFKINPKGTKLSKLTPAKKALTVKWKAQKAKMNKARITGYEIQYSTSKKFTKKTTKVKKVTGYKKTSVKISKLKAKKTYYVRIRTYKKIGKVTYYSKWSKSLKKKTK
ncbi:MAG: fibronectin type III domain-containing protein [Firmicutes bacterium]|nr:fibronectin type III domain-containing protein [Bacillota bacterium]